MAVPVFHYIRDALAQHFGDEKATVEQNRIGTDVSRAFEKCRQVPGHCRIGDQGEAHFAVGAGCVLLRFVGQFARRQKAVQSKLQNFVAQDLGFERSADQR